MLNLLSQVETNFWSGEPNSPRLWMFVIGILVVGFGAMVALLFAPTRLRRPIVASLTFLAGLFWVLYYFWPKPAFRQDGEAPEGAVEGMAFWLEDALPVVGNLANILTAFLLGLGIYSLLRIHIKKLVKQQRDWQFSLILLLSMLGMIIFGYWDWIQRRANPDIEMNWTFVQYSRDMLFDGLLQQMDAAMFSMIAFFILSAAYRAFRIRSIESTILLTAALIMMLSLMGGLVYMWDESVNRMTGHDTGSVLNNLRISEIAGWLRDALQTPSIRAIDFGIGVGALAMGLRLWLSLERGGVST
jgi:hypothetical protein